MFHLDKTANLTKAILKSCACSLFQSCFAIIQLLELNQKLRTINSLIAESPSLILSLQICVHDTACLLFVKLFLNLVHASYSKLLFCYYPTPPIPPAATASVTKSVKWQYLGNQAWYHRSAGVKTTRKLKKKRKRLKMVKMV